jgi:hypothetical protein
LFKNFNTFIKHFKPNKTMKTLRLLSLAAGIALVFAGCTGPAGAPGADGPQGAQGNANVVSLLFTVPNSASWLQQASQYWYQQLTPVGPLTSGFINAGGSVNVFATFNGGTTWNALPYTEVVGANLTASWTVNFTPNLVQVNYAYSDLTLHNDPATEYAAGGAITFNVVCIAPSIMKKHPGTNWHNYYEVQSVVNAENGTRIVQ